MASQCERARLVALLGLALIISVMSTASCSSKPEQRAVPLAQAKEPEARAGSAKLQASGGEDVAEAGDVVQRTPSPDDRGQLHDEEQAEAAYAKQRSRMVAQQLRARDITNERVLQTMARVPRHQFVPERLAALAYVDSALPIDHGQTISQPYIVALMTQLVDPKTTDKALDIGTGSGYQAAVLAELVQSVYSMEIVEPLAREADARLTRLGYKNVHVQHGDGYRGWPGEAPFDVIIVAAAPDHVPKPLVEQLARDGKMMIPVGERFQNLLLIEKSEDGTVTKQKIVPVAFVPMTGEAQKP